MANEIATTVIGGTISLIGTFGSILLNHRLARRREERASAGMTEPLPTADQKSVGIGWLVPLATLLFAIAVGYVSQSLQYHLDPLAAQTPSKALGWAVIVAVIALLWWRARRGGAGFAAFLLDMLILFGGLVAGSSFLNVSYSSFIPGLTEGGYLYVEGDILLKGAKTFGMASLFGGLVFLVVRLFRRNRVSA